LKLCGGTAALGERICQSDKFAQKAKQRERISANGERLYNFVAKRRGQKR
jgi:hypothetical protein